jgi:hypothetical protein
MAFEPGSAHDLHDAIEALQPATAQGNQDKMVTATADSACKLYLAIHKAVRKGPAPEPRLGRYSRSSSSSVTRSRQGNLTTATPSTQGFELTARPVAFTLARPLTRHKGTTLSQVAFCGVAVDRR